jgi:putative oxidoreductase
LAYGILFLRVVLGVIMSGHGAQKAFGWWGGPGRAGAIGMTRSQGFRTPVLAAFALTTCELGGGLLIALGLVTPIAGFAIASVMVTAIALVHWKNGFWVAKGGYEFNLLIYATAVALAATGGMRFSLDNALGIADNLSGLWWGVGAAGAALLSSFVMLTAGRARPSAAAQPA